MADDRGNSDGCHRWRYEYAAAPAVSAEPRAASGSPPAACSPRKYRGSRDPVPGLDPPSALLDPEPGSNLKIPDRVSKFRYSKFQMAISNSKIVLFINLKSDPKISPRRLRIRTSQRATSAWHYGRGLPAASLRYIATTTGCHSGKRSRMATRCPFHSLRYRGGTPDTRCALPTSSPQSK